MCLYLIHLMCVIHIKWKYAPPKSEKINCKMNRKFQYILFCTFAIHIHWNEIVFYWIWTIWTKAYQSVQRKREKPMPDTKKKKNFHVNRNNKRGKRHSNRINWLFNVYVPRSRSCTTYTHPNEQNKTKKKKSGRKALNSQSVSGDIDQTVKSNEKRTISTIHQK